MREAEKTEFFVTGAKTYLDVRDAMDEFERQVRAQCGAVAAKRLAEINEACEMGWTLADLKDYRETPEYGFNCGKRIAVNGLGGLYFCLRLYREGDRAVHAATVYLWRERASIAVDLWNLAPAQPYRRGNNLVFEQILSEHQLQDFQKYVSEATDDFIAFTRAAGGLKKYLAGP